MRARTILFLRDVARRIVPRALRVVLWKMLRSTQKLWRAPPIVALNVMDFLASKGPPSLSAWMEDRRDRLAVAIRPRLVPERKLQGSFRKAVTMLRGRQGGESLGDYLEFGVFNGTSLVCMYRALQEGGFGSVRLFGFDSFQGLPDDAGSREEGHQWSAGQFAASYDFARMVLRHEGVDPDRVRLTPGWFEETLTEETAEGLGLEAASVIMIDCDLYVSTKEALRFSAPLIMDAAILMFDDWHSGGLAERGLGEARAFEEFLREHPEFSATSVQELRYTDNAEVFLVERRVG